MALFLERFVLPVLVALLVAIVMNPLKWDMTQRVSGALTLVCAGIFVAHTAHRVHQQEKAPNATQTSSVARPNPTVGEGTPKQPPTRGEAAVESGRSRDVKSANATARRGGTRIEQRSEGPNSPNIIGDNNQVIFNADAPRTLQEHQAKSLRTALQGTNPQEVTITAFFSSEDAVAYGTEIGNAILAGGWQVRGQAVNRAMATTADNIRGLAILVHDSASPPARAEALQKALKQAGLEAAITQDKALGVDMVLWIGRR